MESVKTMTAEIGQRENQSGNCFSFDLLKGQRLGQIGQVLESHYVHLSGQRERERDKYVKSLNHVIEKRDREKR